MQSRAQSLLFVIATGIVCEAKVGDSHVARYTWEDKTLLHRSVYIFWQRIVLYKRIYRFSECNLLTKSVTAFNQSTAQDPVHCSLSKQQFLSKTDEF